jgi:glycosyltransferase involved in cell wall biosynthesis
LEADAEYMKTGGGKGAEKPQTERIRIARIIDRLNIGGPAKHVAWLSAGLDPREFETLLIAGVVAQGEGDMSYFARDAGVEPRLIEQMSRELNPVDALVIFKLLREFYRFKPQIIHTHKAKAGAVGRIAALIYKWGTPSALLLRPRACSVVHTYHGHIFHSYYGKTKTRVFVTIERALARFCTDRIVAISRRQKNEINESFRVGNEKQTEVVPLGIDFSEIESTPAPSLRRAFGVSVDTVLIGIVGRLCEIKNQAMFIASAAEVRRRRPGVRFVVIGDGHLRAALESQAESLGLGGDLMFTGFRDDVASLYRELDLVALTSLNEGTPLTLIEAMSQSRAVVSTEVGGVLDLMGEAQAEMTDFSLWKHGASSKSEDQEGFASALIHLIDHPRLREQMGQDAQRFVRSQMSKERLIGDIESLYRRLVTAQS